MRRTIPCCSIPRRAVLRSAGLERAEWLDLGVALDNGDGRHRRRLSACTCAAATGSRWLVSGTTGRSPPIFQRTAAHRLLLEYDDARSGGFEQLQHVPDDKMVVLGLITTKRGELEEPDELVSRIEEASRYIDRERLALSPQCGFGTSIIGNKLTQEQQAAKLRLLCDVAERVWG
jgi:5-methyltetrahydropteroyltriglutamate--homocysteine methyltransferase